MRLQRVSGNPSSSCRECDSALSVSGLKRVTSVLLLLKARLEARLAAEQLRVVRRDQIDTFGLGIEVIGEETKRLQVRRARDTGSNQRRNLRRRELEVLRNSDTVVHFDDVIVRRQREAAELEDRSEAEIPAIPQARAPRRRVVPRPDWSMGSCLD